MVFLGSLEDLDEFRISQSPVSTNECGCQAGERPHLAGCRRGRSVGSTRGSIGTGLGGGTGRDARFGGQPCRESRIEEKSKCQSSEPKSQPTCGNAWSRFWTRNL